MKVLTSKGKEQLDAIASRYHVSADAVSAMLQAVVNGGGRMAQFNIQEFGGSGQWMQGGMTMVADMFNHSLKHKVNSLCQELSELISAESVFTSSDINDIKSREGFSGNWWPAEFGSPSSSGAQNNIRYAFFPPPVSRLALELMGKLSVYDTLDHHISGVSQQQGKEHSIVFTSQHGQIDIDKLPIISSIEPNKSKDTDSKEIKEGLSEATVITQNTSGPGSSKSAETDDIITQISRLADLYNKGVLTEAEFTTKKSELLHRL